MLSLAGHAAAVRCVAYSPDGGRLASGAEDGTLRLWDLGRGEPAHVWDNLSESVDTVAFTPDGATLLAGLADGRLVALHVEGKPKFWERAAHPAGVRAVLVHPSWQIAFTAGWDREVCVWPLTAPERARLCPPLTEPPASAALSPDGGRLAVGLSHTYKVLLIDTAVGSQGDSLMSDRGAVFALAFSPDGQVLAAGDSTGQVLLWELGRPRRPRILEGHTWPVYGLGFTPDGRRLVTASSDQTARVWDVGTGRELQVYQWHQESLNCLAVAPDGLTAAAGGDDHRVVVWDLPD